MDRQFTVVVTAVAACTCAVLGIVALWNALGARDVEARQALLEELQRTKQALSSAKEQLRNSQSASSVSSVQSPSPPESKSTPKKPVRVYMDGCFDMMHYGHSNALRQAKACGDVLVVGLVNDGDIVLNKGSPPVMDQSERHSALEACKWVDEVIPNVPYDLTEEWVNTLVNVHHIDFIVHGDDPCITADGKDAYGYAKSIGVYRQVKRTEGVSTTDIVGRMLLMTKEHHIPQQEDAHGDLADANIRSSSLSLGGSQGDDGSETHSESGGGGSRMRRAVAQLPATTPKFLPTARRIMQFAEGKTPRPGDRVVYVCGGWDLFNAGHVAALQEARKLGDFLLVGIHDDATINRMRGKGLPILNLYERALSLLSCKYVDEIILGAPWSITEDLIKTMNIAVVAKGTSSDIENAEAHKHLALDWMQEDVGVAVHEEYAVPERLGILRSFPSPRSMSALTIVERILASRGTYQARYDSKAAKEADYVKSKEYVEET